MALTAVSFIHMQLLPTPNFTSKKYMTVTIKCANDVESKAKVGRRKPGSTGKGGEGPGPKTTNSQLQRIPAKNSDDDDEDDDYQLNNNTFAFNNLNANEWLVIFLFLLSLWVLIVLM
ncbi:unnamed protein product [Lathyrus oleraceus]|uniref:Uncharacterized protein n=1 Tax=Pisum sativum TaxID=3888 RepID=A0A9D5AH32_PEA|nr:uncharacterized protein LOC127083050 [Pisum sativum]KAI5411577.1 hypothetical protein KIW84_056586 [Pisum sativum]